jgi:hypothetical protein
LKVIGALGVFLFASLSDPLVQRPLECRRHGTKIGMKEMACRHEAGQFQRA